MNIFSNLYQPQKLLSIDSEFALPMLQQSDQLQKGIRGFPQGLYDWNPASPEQLPISRSLYDGAPTYPTVAFVGMVLVLVYVAANIYKWWTRPRRKKPRPRKNRNAPFVLKIAGV